MSQSKLLRKLEYILVAASAAGLVFALETKQSSLWAIVPLTGTMIVNVLNRRSEDKNSTRSAIDELGNVEQRMLGKVQWLEDTVKALPAPIEPTRVDKLEQITKLNREALGGLEKRLMSLAALETVLPELQKNLNLHQTDLEDNKKAIELIQEKIESIPTRSDVELQTKETFNILQSKQKLNQEEIAGLTDKINNVSWRIEELHKSDRKIDKLREEFDRFLHQQEIQSITSELDPPLGSYNFTSVAKQLEILKEKSTDSQAAIIQLQQVLKDIPSQREIEEIKYKLQTLEIVDNTLNGSSESSEIEVIKSEIAELKAELAKQKLNHNEEEHSAKETPNKSIFSWLNTKF